MKLLSSRSFWRYKNIFADHTLDLKKGFNYFFAVGIQYFWNMKHVLASFFCVPNLSPPKTNHQPHHHFLPIQNANHLLTMAISTTKPTNKPTNGRSNQPSDTPRSRCHRRICATEESHQLHRRWHTHVRPNGRSTWLLPKLPQKSFQVRGLGVNSTSLLRFTWKVLV